MYATHLTQQSAGRSRKFGAMVGAALALVIAAANVDTAAASESFPDNITVSGAAKCDSYGTAFSICVMASPTNPSYWYPYPMTSYVALRLVNTSTTPTQRCGIRGACVHVRSRSTGKLALLPNWSIHRPGGVRPVRGRRLLPVDELGDDRRSELPVWGKICN